MGRGWRESPSEAKKKRHWENLGCLQERRLTVVPQVDACSTEAVLVLQGQGKEPWRESSEMTEPGGQRRGWSTVLFLLLPAEGRGKKGRW